jgi:small conductance mechanosensitive channel
MDELRSMLGIFGADDWKAFTSTATSILLILALAAFVRAVAHRLIRAFRLYVQARADDPGRAQRVETVARTFRYVTTVVIAIVAGTLVLGQLGISIAPILAAAGVAGIAVGFAAQSLIKDYFNGFFLLIEDQVRVGDVVEVTGVSGRVEGMTLRYIQLRNFDGHVFFVPNGTVDKVKNLTRDFAQAVIEVGVAYREDADEALAIMREVGQAMRADEVFGPKIADDTELIGVERWDDSAVIVRCRLKIVPPIEQWSVRREFLKRLKKAYDERGIEIPFPHLTLYPGQPKNGDAPALQVVSRAA